jgi:hypothetical protein
MELSAWGKEMADKLVVGRFSLRKRFALGLIIGIILAGLTLFMIGKIVPSHVSPATASNFFFASAGVNATLLVAISVTIPTILKQTPGHRRTRSEIFLTAELMVVFFGLVTSGIGILYFDPALPLDIEEFQEFVYLVFGTWVVSFALIISGIWAAIPKDCDHDE